MHWIDPDCLQETRGTVTQFLLNPHGELDGFILGENQQVHFPPHMSKQVAKHISIGDTVIVRGVKPRSADIVAAVLLTSSSGVAILDEGPHDGKKHKKPHAEKQPMEVTGEVKLSLYGPKGELRGALLVDGTTIRMAPHAAAELVGLGQQRALTRHVPLWNRAGRPRPAVLSGNSCPQPTQITPPRPLIRCALRYLAG